MQNPPSEALKWATKAHLVVVSRHERFSKVVPQKARLVEAFASLQGEGRRVGERQVFLRFAVCDRKCIYCDTPESIGKAPDSYRVGLGWDPNQSEYRSNPVTGQELTDLLSTLCEAIPDPIVSLTGGEL